MIFDRIRDSAAFKEALAGLKTRGSNITLTGPGSGASAHFACAFFAETGSKFIIIAPNELSVSKIRSDLLTLGDFTAERILTLRPLEYMLYDVDARSSETEGERVKTLYALATEAWDVLILTPTAAAQQLPEKRYIAGAALTVAPGDICEPAELADRLSQLGYIRVTQVDGKPVSDVKALHEAVKDRREFNLSVRRLATTRIVRVKLQASAKTDKEEGNTTK